MRLEARYILRHTRRPWRSRDVPLVSPHIYTPIVPLSLIREGHPHCLFCRQMVNHPASSFCARVSLPQAIQLPEMTALASNKNDEKKKAKETAPQRETGSLFRIQAPSHSAPLFRLHMPPGSTNSWRLT